MKTLLASLLLILAVLAAHDETLADTHASSRLRDFNLHHCAHGSCFRAKGGLGLVSMGGDSLSAADVRLELKRSGQPAANFLCASFRYDLRSDSIVCDNRDAAGAASLVVDRDFRVTRFPARG